MHLDSILKHSLKLMLTALFIASASPLFSQAVPAVNARGVPVTAGVGVSSWDVDWAHSRMIGLSAWTDWSLPRLPNFLDGLGIELEARDVDWDHGDKASGFRQASIGGGPIYQWRHYRNFRPYAKGVISFGGFDFGSCVANCNTSQPYDHDTRTVYAPGGGVEYRILGNFWARADYEYQFWPKLTGNTFLNPQGFTFGAEYSLRRGGYR